MLLRQSIRRTTYGLRIITFRIWSVMTCFWLGKKLRPPPEEQTPCHSILWRDHLGSKRINRGLFAVQFGNYFRHEDQLRSGIICDALQIRFLPDNQLVSHVLPLLTSSWCTDVRNYTLFYLNRYFHIRI